MNKKFSTLLAGALLAGALLAPSELSAKLQYLDGKTYETVDKVSTAQAGEYYLVTAAGKVISVAANGGFQATDLANANASNTIVLTSSGSNFKIQTGQNKLGAITYVTGAAWSNDALAATRDFGVNVSANPIITVKPAFKTFYVKSDLSLTESNVNLGDAKLVPASALTDHEYVSEITSDLSAPYFLLMSRNNQVINGAGELVGYTPIVDQDLYWSVKVSGTTATFVNKKTGATLKDAEGNVISAKLEKDLTGNYTNLGNLQLLVPGGNATIDGQEDFIAALGVIYDINNITAEELMSITGSGFQASIKKYVDGNKKDKTLASNPFDGILKPVKFKTAGSATIVGADDDATSYMIQNAEGNILVIDLNDKYAAGTGTKYALKAISPKVLANAIADSKASIANRYAYEFIINASEAFVPGQDQKINTIIASNAAGDNYRLGSVDLSGVPTLAAESVNEFFLNNITIKLGQFNTVDVKGLLGKTPTFFTVTNKAIKKDSKHYGTVLGLDEYAEYAFVKKSEALIGYPETQWALTYDAGSNELTFTNRENPDASMSENVATIYYTNTDHVYAINGDTLEIKPVTKFAEADGYLRLNADELRDQQYYVAAASSVFDNVAYLVENHKDDHQVGLDTKKENATAWNVATAMYEGLNNLGDRIEYRPDTVLVKSVLGYYDANGDYQETKDDNGEGTTMLKLLAYSFQNNANQEYFAYDGSMNRYATGKSGSKTGYTKDNAQLFAAKMVADGKYNLIPVVGEVLTHESEGKTLNAAEASKMYSGDGAVKGILNNTAMYSQTENDLFVIEKKDAPEYRKVAMTDTIKIFRDENEAQILFEKGEFLSIANAVQFPNTNPALYVDTAYVDRGSNNRWEYLLAVNAKHWDSKVDCDIPGHPKHEADTTTGRFLVNLMDSAYVYGDANLHNNKFINEEDGESYAKLGFVEGYHTHDTLYLQRPNGTYAELPMNREDYSHSIAKYAFRYVDQEQGSFVVETGRKDFGAEDAARDVVNTGYLKWLNGVVVVVDDIKKADVFNLSADKRTPTSNETTTVSSISIVATKDAVIVKGAAGKKVAINNILGQSIANTVLSSDHATIAVQAGIVVVAVEGEEAVKVVVE